MTEDEELFAEAAASDAIWGPEDFKEWRLSLNWTRPDAAKALGIPEATIESYEVDHSRKDRIPVEIPLDVKRVCLALAKDAETDSEFVHRLKVTTNKHSAPTAGEAERFHHLEFKEWAEDLYLSLSNSKKKPIA